MTKLFRMRHLRKYVENFKASFPEYDKPASEWGTKDSGVWVFHEFYKLIAPKKAKKDIYEAIEP